MELQDIERIYFHILNYIKQKESKKRISLLSDKQVQQVNKGTHIDCTPLAVGFGLDKKLSLLRLALIKQAYVTSCDEDTLINYGIDVYDNGLPVKDELNQLNELLFMDSIDLDAINVLTKQLFNETYKLVSFHTPHTPFLTEEFVCSLTTACVDNTSKYPLLNQFSDGYLECLLPEKQADDIISKAKIILCKERLPFDLELNVSAKGFPSLSNGQPCAEEIYDFLSGDKDVSATSKNKADLFRVNVDDLSNLRSDIDSLLQKINLTADYPKSAGATQHLFSVKSIPNSTVFADMCLISLMLNLTVDNKKCINTSERVNKLIDIGFESMGLEGEFKEERTERIIYAIHFTGLIQDNQQLREKMLVEFNKWLDGDDNYAGLKHNFTGMGAQVSIAVDSYIDNLVNGRMQSFDNDELGRCIFTGEHVPMSQSIDSKTGMHGLKVSAFSGRENRPEVFNSAKALTNVGFISIAEHRLRTIAHMEQGGKNDGVPTNISIPVGVGGFSGFNHNNGFKHYSVFDLARQEKKKGKVFDSFDIHTNMIRVARFELMPPKLADQVDKLRLIINAALRTGRPTHIFRGLPYKNKNFFTYDAMPAIISKLIGGQSINFQQCVDASKKLKFASSVLEYHDLGYDALSNYLSPATKFQAICKMWCVIRGSGDCGLFNQHELSVEIENEYRKEILSMGSNDIHELGKKATRIQKYCSYTDSVMYQQMCLMLSFEAATSCVKVGQNEKESIVSAVLSKLMGTLKDKKLLASSFSREGGSLIQECEEFAKLFTENIWFGICNGGYPSQRKLNGIKNIFRMSFIMEHKRLSNERRNEQENKV